MQATYARKTFPCFDEPAMKASFNVTIVHERETVALSNGIETNRFPDFNAGAMENWGLVTYRETALLFDPLMSSTGNKERVTTWFGNLVTLQWWNDLWLNEGFASYVEYLGADYAEPTWNIKDNIVLFDVQKVFAVDALASSHPLSRGEEESYLNTFAFSNTVYTDLWDHLQQAVENTPSIVIPHTVHDIMNRWTLQMGFPVVTIDTRTGNTHEMMRVSGEDWVLANTNVSGYFRVNYDPENWDRLLTLLNTNHQALSIINRAQIIDDAFNLARAKIIDTTLALRTTKYLSNEREYIPWESALRNLNYYILMFDRTEYNEINAIGMACSMGVKGCRELIQRWYGEWMENPQLNPYLEYTLDPTKIRKQDATSTIRSLAGNVVGMPLAWNFVRARWSYIFNTYGRGSFSFSNLISGITRRFSTEFELQEVSDKFKEDNLHVGFGSATLALEQAIEKTRANIKWVTENKAPVMKWCTEESQMTHRDTQ
ncbi:hypothetical protein F7725_025823 [Dissostichus mawsoni]|uniref:Aminopeptidase N n=1 Tax=Dissostichus mawsoni TaxID=36200 RepID=A0A7J5X6R7_DISMA|nr:hypothetical protein F7725_025823 [Dissostichus mawsoni]